MLNAQVAVAGGGIGGLTLAAALAGKGIEVQVLERARAFDAVGAGITMQINAMQALRQIGLAEQVEAAGNRLNRLILRDASGSEIFSSDMTQPARKYGVPFVGIHRARLHEVLQTAVPKGALIHGFEVSKFKIVGERVVVSSDDVDHVEADALVGADGLRSQIRSQLWGDERLRYSGITSWRGVVDDHGYLPRDEAVETWGDSSIFGHIPISDGKLYWFATKVCQPGQTDDEDPRESILRIMGHWHRPIPDVVKATTAESILRTDIWDRPARLPWGAGRVTLLGDAAHPMTPNMGQGGGQAVEDAVVLAEMISRSNSIVQAFRAYEKKRFRRTKFFVDNSRRATALSHGMTPLTRFARKWIVTRIPNWFRERQVHKVFRFEAE